MNLASVCPDCGGELVEVRYVGGLRYFCPTLIGVLEWSEEWQQHFTPYGDCHRRRAIKYGYEQGEVVPIGATRREVA